MSDSTDQKRAMIARLKVALIPVLGLAIVGVVLWRYQSDRGAQLTALTELNPDAVAALKAAKAKSANARHWPKVTLEEIQQFNPFNVLAAPMPEHGSQQSETSDEASAEPDAVLVDRTAGKRLATGQVQAIYQDPKGFVAIVDSRIVRVGDRLNGYRVAEITPQGVVLENE